MASTDNRPAFRLPWQSGHGSASDRETAGTAVVEPPAWPSHDLARRQTRTPAGAANPATPTDTQDQGTAAMPADATPDVPAATRSDMTVTATPAVHETADLRIRKPTKFLADLTRAMRQAADEARQSALAQFQADVERHTTEARGTCEVAATDARRRADEDITALGEWETAEIARIRHETEEGITARHARLESELAAQAAQLEAELTRVNGQVEAFAAEMDAFFQRLLQEEDPAHFAAMAEQLPEPPAFEEWAVATVATVATAVTPADDAGMPAMQQSDYAAAEAEAAAWSTEEPVAGESTDAPGAEAEAAAGESSTEAPETAGTADPDAAASMSTEPWPTPAAARASTVRTQVAVVGLVSVASIATFKRMLGRVPGVHGVQVSSGPDGEFLFNVTHDESLDMATAVQGVQGFEVEVLESGPGIVSCRAVDPEVV